MRRINRQDKDFSFGELHRLFRHLRRGGTRKGACGWAEIPYEQLETRLAGDKKFAALVENTERYVLAQDEQRLDKNVCKGDRQCLLYRLRRGYGAESGRGNRELRQTTDEKSQAYAVVEREIGALGPEKRKRTVGEYREAAASVA